jgi:hypothetical protein
MDMGLSLAHLLRTTIERIKGVLKQKRHLISSNYYRTNQATYVQGYTSIGVALATLEYLAVQLDQPEAQQQSL